MRKFDDINAYTGNKLKYLTSLINKIQLSVYIHVTLANLPDDCNLDLSQKDLFYKSQHITTRTLKITACFLRG